MSKGRATILIVDDERDLAEAFGEYLGDLGHDVRIAGSIVACERALAERPVDLIVLDLNLPGEDGLAYLKRLSLPERVPVIVMTANTDLFDRVVGLELGADDFVVKPVDPQELAARIAGLLARYGARGRTVLRLEAVTVDLSASCLLWPGGRIERLGPGEVALLRLFSDNPNRLLSREAVIEAAPADTLDVNDRAVDARVARLRKKLETEAIVTLRGRGYMFVPPQGAPTRARREPDAEAEPDRLP